MITPKFKWLTISVMVFILVGCGARHKPIIDTQGVNMAAYQQDLYECQQYAEQVDSKAGKGAVGGALVGGLIGAAIGNSDTAKKGAGVGAIKGGLRGGAKTKREKAVVVKNCLRGRGYRVLN